MPWIRQIYGSYWQALVHYGDFSGRTSRKDYWLFFIGNFILTVIIEGIDTVLTGRAPWPLFVPYTLALFIPSISIGFRRLHDIGRSGWAFLWLLMPVIGWIVLFIFDVLPGQPHPNRYGPPR